MDKPIDEYADPEEYDVFKEIARLRLRRTDFYGKLLFTQRRVYDLIIRDGLSFKQVSRRMGVSKSAVEAIFKTTIDVIRRTIGV